MRTSERQGQDAVHVMLVAGEPSGDALGAPLIAALRTRFGDALTITGVGGALMEGEGLRSLFSMSDLAVMGFAEVLPRVPAIFRRLAQTEAAARGARPDVLVTIDAPGFNFRLAKRLRGSGIPIVHYVAPTVWAWRPGRAKTAAKLLDHLLALFPFEPPYFVREGLPCTYVGHPAVGQTADAAAGASFRSRHGIEPGDTLLAVLPGSRSGELARHLPVFGAALERLASRGMAVRAVVPTLAHLAAGLREVVSTWPVETSVIEGEAERLAAFAAADAALAVSGTVTLELGLARVPMVVAYRAHPVSALIARRLVKVPHVSLPNLVLGSGVVPEFLLGDCTPDALATALADILVDPVRRATQSRALGDVFEKLSLGDGGSSQRAAGVVAEVAGGRSTSTDRSDR